MGIRVITTRTAKGSPLTWEEADANFNGIDVDLTTLETDMTTKASLTSPAFVGVPTAPTAAPGVNTTQLATTAYVVSAVTAGTGVTSHPALTNLDYASSGHTGFASSTDARFPTTDQKAALAGTSGTPATGNRFVTNTDSRLSDARTPTAHAATHATGQTDPITPAAIGAAALASPAFTGTPTAPTATTGVNTTQLATTAFVNSSISAITYPDTVGIVNINNSGGGLKGTITADSAGDTITLQEGTNVVMTVDSANNRVTIASTAAGGVTAHSALTQLDYASAGHTGFASATDLTSHVGTTNIHFTQAAIDHTAILNRGSNTHSQIDTAVTNSSNHISSTSNPHSVTANQVGNFTAQWNANALRGVDVADTAPTDAYVLTYSDSSSSWVPAAATGGGGGLETYDAGDAIVTASAVGVTATFAGGGSPQTMTLSIPNGVTIYAIEFPYLSNGNEIELYCCPGNASEGTFKWPSVTIWNQGANPRTVESFALRKASTEQDRVYWVGSSNGTTYNVRVDITYTGNGT